MEELDCRTYIRRMLYDRFGYVAPFAIPTAIEFVTLLVKILLVREIYTTSDHSDRSHLTWIRSFQGFPSLPAFYALMLISFGFMFAWAFIEPHFM